MELSKQEMELFLHLLGLWSKNFFDNIFPIFTKEIKIDFKTGYGIIQTGNGSPTLRSLIKKLFLRHLLHIYQGIEIVSSKQDMELSKQEIELFLPLAGLWSRNFFYKILFISTKEFNIDS